MSYSDDEDEEELCARMSAVLDSRLSFQQEWAGQGGGAAKYSSFHVDSFNEDDEDGFDDDLVFTTTCSTNQDCTEPQLKLSSPCSNGFSGHAPFQEHDVTPPVYPVVNGLASDEDDGWDSDDPGIFQSQSTPTTMPDAYKVYGYGEWEDELQAMFASSWKEEPDKVRALVQEMFETHEDVHNLICFFLRRVGRRRPKKVVLHKLVLEEFEKWKGQRKNNLPKNAILTSEHQKEILKILTRCHTTYLEILSSLFELHTAPTESLVEVAKQVLKLGRLKEAVTCIFTFGIQDHFSVEEILLPLVGLDKMNLIESYVEGKREEQVKFVKLLDALCEPGMTNMLLSRYLGTSRWVEPGVWLNPNSKLNVKQLHKLGLRFVAKYRLDLGKGCYVESVMVLRGSSLNCVDVYK